MMLQSWLEAQKEKDHLLFTRAKVPVEESKQKKSPSLGALQLLVQGLNTNLVPPVLTNYSNNELHLDELL